jgi:hypothetical protein
VEQALGTVIFVVVLAAAVVAVLTLATTGRDLDRIGRGGLSLRDGTDRPPGEAAGRGGGVDLDVEAEVRRLVAARSERLVRRGGEPLDVEAEVARRLRELRGG